MLGFDPITLEYISAKKWLNTDVDNIIILINSTKKKDSVLCLVVVILSFVDVILSLVVVIFCLFKFILY